MQCNTLLGAGYGMIACHDIGKIGRQAEEEGDGQYIQHYPI